jgi:hypothetical protein
MDPDADPDPTIFVIGLQDTNKGTFTSFFKEIKSPKEVTKQ